MGGRIIVITCSMCVAVALSSAVGHAWMSSFCVNWQMSKRHAPAHWSVV